MYDLAIAIIGSGDTTYNNAADLLEDFLPDNYVVYIPSYINSSGMKNVWKFLQDAQINYDRVKRSDIIEILIKSETKNRQLVVLNSDGIENEISACLNAKIPVLDLTRGLYQITEVGPGSSESNSEAIAEQTPAPVSPENDLASVSVAELAFRLGLQGDTISALIDRIERLEKAMSVGIGETNWEPSQNTIPPEEDVLGAGETGFKTGVYDPDAASKVAYWKSKRGKFRKAGKSKARPGETMVYLTQDEIDKLE